MSSNSHSQAPDVKTFDALQRMGQAEARLQFLAHTLQSQNRISRFSFALFPDLKTFTTQIQAFPAETQLQQIESRITYIKEVQQDDQEQLPAYPEFNG